MYGTSLRLPGEFFAPHATPVADPASYVTQLKSSMRALHCTPTRRLLHSSRRPDTSLSSASLINFVFVRPLQPPYDGPYRVLDRFDQFYTLDLNGRRDSVSIDRLKPAHVDFPVTPEVQTPSSSTTPTPTPPSQPTFYDPLDVVPEPPATRITCLGRHVHWPAHLRDFAS